MRAHRRPLLTIRGSLAGHSLLRFGLWLQRRGYLPLSLVSYLLGRAWPDQDMRDSPVDRRPGRISLPAYLEHAPIRPAAAARKRLLVFVRIDKSESRDGRWVGLCGCRLGDAIVHARERKAVQCLGSTRLPALLGSTYLGT